MKKKLFSFLAVAMLAGSSQLFAWGIGLQGGGGPCVGGLAVTFKLDQVPLVFAVDMDFFGGFGIGATADYWIMNPNIMEWDWGRWNWYWGLGAMVAGKFGGDYYSGFAVGPRIFAGMNLDFLQGKASWLDHLEAFLQVAWQPSFHFGPNPWTDSDFYWMGWCFPVTTGIRMWF